jgi:hypothetical protein
MSEQKGPLSRLIDALGIDADLEPIAAVKRIDEQPVALNPECFFKMAPAPELMSDTGIHKLFGDDIKTPIDLRGKRIDPRYELHGTFRGKQQWTCWDYNSYDGDESAMGSGDSKEAALLDLLEKIAPEEQPPQMTAPLLYRGGQEPDDYGPERRVSDPDEE